MEDLLQKFLQGDKRALARAITHVENDTETGRFILNKLLPKRGNSQIIGITGAPGSGKSTIVDKLIGEFKNHGHKVGVIAVDPSSPFSSGAILGDRVRMLKYTQDPNVYIRSMSSRGHLGGLAISTYNAVLLLDSFGYDKIIIETVGAGQTEVDIAKTCDTTIVVLVPGLGDDIQLIKAGIMEIADIFCINKSDKIGANELAVQLKGMIEEANWTIPVVLTNALNADGIAELVNVTENHWDYLKKNNLLDMAIINRMSDELIQRTIRNIDDILINSRNNVNNISKKLISGEISLDTALVEIINILQMGFRRQM